jgi:hypothetical protein
MKAPEDNPTIGLLLCKSITLNGTKGLVYKGDMALVDAEPSKNESFKEFMKKV